MKRSLHVALNDYPGANCDLRGCLNDANALAQRVVKQYGFAAENVRLLYDSRATAAGIKDRIENWLVKGLHQGDEVLFSYSGHGDQLAARADSGEVDRLTECLCPYDYNFTETHSISDDYLYSVFSRLPYGVHLTVIADSCHSGDLSRSFFSRTRSRKFPKVPEDVQWRNNLAAKLVLSRSAKGAYGAWLEGCRSDQTSADAYIKGRYQGAFSWALYSELDAGAAAATLPTLIQRVNSRLSKAGYAQRPQLEGSSSETARCFLGGKDNLQ
jgi:metacaspase-1